MGRQGQGAIAPRWVRGDDCGDFVLQGTDIEVPSDSVSSEWTSESGEEGEAARRQVRTWRIRRKLAAKKGGEGGSASESESSSSGSSSSTSTGSSSSSGGEVARQKRQRKQLLAEWQAGKAQGRPPAPQLSSDPAAAPTPPPLPQAAAAPPPPPSSAPTPLPAALATKCEQRAEPAGPLDWMDASKRYRCFAVARKFLSLEDINAIHTAAQHPTVREINDRKGYLAFKHQVWRFEAQLRALFPSLYFRLMELMRLSDESKWRRLRRNSRKKKKVYPEIEYISYDVAEMGEPCYIEPHVDNKSAVTLVGMLSQRSSYVGGHSCFRRVAGTRGHREMELQQGDVVVFRGEKLTHWITPVTAGKRVVLQIELSRV